MASHFSRGESLYCGPSWTMGAAPSRLLAAAGFGLFSLLISIVLIRRLAGGFTGGISLLGYVFCLLVAGLYCCGLKVTAEWPPHRLNRRSGLIFGVLIGLPLDVLAIAILPSNWSTVWMGWALGLSVLSGWFCLSTRSVDGLWYVVQEVIWPEIQIFLFPAGRPGNESPSGVVVAPESSREVTDHVLSELQRRSTAQGEDLLEGEVVAVFGAGNRQTVLHVPFVPPFSAVPRVECEVADGSETRIKVGAVFPYGVRLELKRNTPELPETHVRLGIFVEAGGASPAEAA